MSYMAQLLTVSAAVMLGSYFLSGLIIKASLKTGLGRDELSGIQKIHVQPVPRLGGVAIFLTFALGFMFMSGATHSFKEHSAYLIVCLLPVVVAGLLEDLTRQVGALSRLFMAMVSGGMGWWLLDAGLFRVGFQPIDGFLQSSVLAGLCMTVMAAAGSAHGVNIIDGCNGLSSFFIMAALAAIAIIALHVDDPFVFRAAVIGLASTAGMFLWNFPRGSIFLGDAGAYMMGYLIAQLCMVLLTYHGNVSPWAAMMIMMYPAWETIFSIYRRARYGVRHIGKPDARHLHQLIYRRIMKWTPSETDYAARSFRSAFTSVLIWPLILLSMVAAMVFWGHTAMLFACCGIFALTYTVTYISIARFKVPRFITRYVFLRKLKAEKKFLAKV